MGKRRKVHKDTGKRLSCEYCGGELKYGKRFCSSKCRSFVVPMPPRPDRTGCKPSNYKGRIRRNGYWAIHLPEHPYSNKQGYVFEHRLVVEKNIGRYLKPTEVVHHIDYDKTNNKVENLQLLSSNAQHKDIHRVCQKQCKRGHIYEKVGYYQYGTARNCKACIKYREGIRRG